MKALRIPSLRRLNKNPDGLGALAIIAAAGAGLYLLGRKKKVTTTIPVLEPSGPPREEPEAVIVENGAEGKCEWTIRTKNGRFGYWVNYTHGGGGSANDSFATIEDARVDLGERLVQLANMGEC